jgi:hypothetical protein
VCRTVRHRSRAGRRSIATGMGDVPDGVLVARSASPSTVTVTSGAHRVYAARKGQAHDAVKGMPAAARAVAARRWRIAIMCAYFAVALPRECELTATMFGCATSRL